MRRLLTPTLLLVALLALFLGHLADKDTLLGTRDIPIFHLPLRTALLDAAQQGMPTWNPGIHGGQPILSNPNYAAFYPLTWLMVLVPVHSSIGLTILIHAAIAFVGARRFAIYLGCSEGPALLAATGFAFAGASLATTSLLTTFCGLAWMPWILYGCDRCFRAPGRRVLLRLAVLPAIAFALQILAGEPVIVVTTGVAALVLALAPREKPVLKASRLAIVCLIAILLAAAQLLPTYLRLSDTPRAGGLDLDDVLTWSTSTERFVELLWPRAWGDPMRIDEDLYFGWSLNDRQYPYLLSIYSGQLVLFLAFGALTRWRVRKRAAWLAMIAAGAFLALGGNNPLIPWLGRVVPFLSQIRYPEKFFLLVTAALAFAAALGWQRVLDARETDQPALEDYPLALASFILLLNALFVGLLWQRPEVGAWFARSHSAMPLGPELSRRAVDFLRAETLAAFLVSASTVLVFALHRWRRVPRKFLIVLTLSVLIADLYYYNHSLTPVVPAREVLTAPVALADLRPGRIFTDRSVVGAPPVIFKTSRPGPAAFWDHVDHANPYLGTVWGFPYAVHRDFDLMATAPARSSFALLEDEWSNATTAQRILGAWNVRYLITARPLEDILEDRFTGIDGSQIVVAENPEFRDRYRFESNLEFHARAGDALAADRESGFLRAHWIAPERAAAPPTSAVETTILEVQEAAAHTKLLYRADGLAPLTVARTYHSGWRAGIDGRATTLYRTSLGMMGLLVPPGEHEVELRFREPATLPALVVSLLAWIGVLAALLIRSPRSPAHG